VSVAELSASRAALLRDLLGALSRTAAQHGVFVQAIASQLGIGATDLDCLLLLNDGGPATAGQLAEVLGLTTGAITGVVDRLTAAGLVVRESDASDRRRVIVRPLADQAPRLDELFSPVLSLLARLLEPVDEATLAQFIHLERGAGTALEQAAAQARAALTSNSGAASFSGPIGALQLACLEFPNGASNVRIFGAAASADELYHATFEGVQPTVRAQGGTVMVRYRRLGPFEWGAARHAGSVSLNPGIPWSIAMRSGGSGVSIDARRLELRAVTIEGGASKLAVSLPAPHGTVPVCIDGGANRVDIHHPAGVPLQLQVRGGANRLEFDAQRFGAVGGELRLASPGWELAGDRYDIEVRGGASRLTVQEEE
jgi:DNA-binding MarR family transcriptional regulator